MKPTTAAKILLDRRANMDFLRKIRPHLTNGLAILVIAALHTQYALSADGFGTQFRGFAATGFFRICRGTAELPVVTGRTNIEAMAAFAFFYFGLLLVPIAVLLHRFERLEGRVPRSFAVTYLVVVAIGAYMVPSSGMTLLMLPHALWMIGRSLWAARSDSID